MNRHQVLTGSVNASDQCYAVGSVEGIFFTAYASGCDVVILASDFQRVQILAGAAYGNVQVTGIDCCTDAGKVAASYGKKVCVFEPAPLLHHDSSHKLDYQWYHTGTVTTDHPVLTLSWNQEGTRLLTGGVMLQLWQLSEPVAQDTNVNFFIDDDEGSTPTTPHWTCVWHAQPATPVHQLQFSPDGLLFATAGKADRLVKIWYENKKVQLPLVRNDSVSPKKEDLNYGFVYIAHPRAVTGFSWRSTSKYMPRGSVANMLLTSCADGTCRLWVETLIPEDGLVDVNQIDRAGASTSPLFHTQRTKRRFMARLHHIRQVMHKRKRPSPGPGGTSLTVPSLPSTQSVHDFHKFGVHPNSVAPGFHFHLAASINPDTDIPLLPAMGRDSDHRHGFSVHWLNNKELQFTSQAEQLMATLSQHVTSHGASPEHHTPCVSEAEDSEREDGASSDMELTSSPTTSPKHLTAERTKKKKVPTATLR